MMMAPSRPTEPSASPFFDSPPPELVVAALMSHLRRRRVGWDRDKRHGQDTQDLVGVRPQEQAPALGQSRRPQEGQLIPAPLHGQHGGAHAVGVDDLDTLVIQPP